MQTLNKMKPNQEARRERIYHFFLENKSKGKTFTVDHFQAEGVAKSTIYDIIERAENEFGPERRAGSGRIPQIMTKTNLSKIKKIFDHKDSISQTQAARQFNCHQTYICKTLQRHTEIKLRKKQKIPERTEEQKVKIRERCGILNSKYRNLSWLRYLEFIQMYQKSDPLKIFGQF